MRVNYLLSNVNFFVTLPLLICSNCAAIAITSRSRSADVIQDFFRYSCDGEVLQIYSQLSFASLKSSNTGFMTQVSQCHERGPEIFKSSKHLLPKCIAIWTRNCGSVNKLLVEVSQELNELSYLQLKPTILVIHSIEDTIISSNRNYDINALASLNDIFNGTRFQINSDIFALVHQSNYYALWEVYNIKSKQIIAKISDHLDLKITSVGGAGGDLVSMPSPSPVARRDFHGEIIGVTIRTKQPDWMHFSGKGENITFISGFSVNIYWDFKSMLNFSERAVIGDGLVTLPNKTLGGKTVSQLHDGVADLSLSQSSVVPFRAKHLTFIQPTYQAIINCFFKQPSANSIRNIVTAPFTLAVWLALMGTWLFLITLVKTGLALKRRYNYQSTSVGSSRDSLSAKEYQLAQEAFRLKFNLNDDYQSKTKTTTTGYWNPIRDAKESESEDDDHDDENDGDFHYAKEVGMWAFAANCQKSWRRIPSSYGMKMMFLVGMLCGVVCYVGYSGAIVSTLTVAIVPVKQFADLISFKFKLTVHEWSEPFQNFLQLMIDTENLKQAVLKISTAEEISHLLDSKKPRGFLTYSDLFYPTALELNYTEIFICKHISKVQVSSVFYKSGMFLKKGSQFTEFFNHKIIILKERGFNFRYLRRYEITNIFPCGDDSSSFNAVEISDVFTAFLVVISGLITSFILLVLEITFVKCSRRKTEQNKK